MTLLTELEDHSSSNYRDFAPNGAGAQSLAYGAEFYGLGSTCASHVAVGRPADRFCRLIYNSHWSMQAQHPCKARIRVAEDALHLRSKRVQRLRFNANSRRMLNCPDVAQIELDHGTHRLIL